MANANVLGYFFQAGLVVKTVMLILLAASIVSWTLIIQRAWFFRRIKQHYETFSKRFWESGDLSKLYAELDSNSTDRYGLAAIFHSGFKEFLRIRKLGQIVLEPIQRVMQISHAKEAERLEQHLPLFASVGSIAPYVGLFGTVWGIMTSFQALGHAQQATIAMVAPGISEALVATALGLFTAIPAVIAFNRYTAWSNALLDRYDLFQEELIALITQQTSSPGRG
ncbi:protein TolQ [Legionella oakridgensis]|uniref:Tol-Pal system protein TolQ n=2 Tax=Legionella oakridgensis TaxID=29423 RepID=W0BB46_9GAMM|nr:protein TolQ [Legionella oakridgensis]AHE67085.1 TolQ protein [Legionella oakridgensis ATCC 33761 = DSM 21215]ETO93265.1 cell division and transport-associated protein TolQ [Legionella oakridgensis RV-2-2007]KTD44455.1 biopolymer transport protein TolQ [Legionella oakridgensis]STY20176.1 biopolymer transport protein TolQ [Legionella longbeachae]